MLNSYADQTQKEFLVNWLEHYILKSNTISWTQKGIFIYILAGKGSKNEIYNNHVESTLEVSTALRHLMTNELIYYNKASKRYELKVDFSRSLFTFKLTNDDTLNSLIDDPDISYASKGLITFISSYSNLQISIKSILKYSTSTHMELTLIINELSEKGYVHSNQHTISLSHSPPIGNDLILMKDRIQQVYANGLKSQLALYLSNSNDNHFKGWSDILYSDCYNLSILQIVVIVSDNIYLYKLLEHDIVTDYNPYDPLKMAYLFNNHGALSILLGTPAIQANNKNVYELFAKMIMDNQPLKYINYFLSLVDNIDRESWISYLMLPAFYRKRYDVQEMLLEIGADPNQPVSKNGTLFSLAVQQEDVDAIVLMKKYM